MNDFSEAYSSIVGDTWLDDLARESLIAAHAKWHPDEPFPYPPPP